jgi:hypothetical protein
MSAVVTILYERVVTVFVVVDVSTQISRLNKDRHHVQYTLAAFVAAAQFLEQAIVDTWGA